MNKILKKIESSDIEEIKKQKNNLLKIRIETSEAVTWAYEDYIDANKQILKSSLNKEINKYFQNNNDEISK